MSPWKTCKWGTFRTMHIPTQHNLGGNFWLSAVFHKWRQPLYSSDVAPRNTQQSCWQFQKFILTGASISDRKGGTYVYMLNETSEWD